MNLEKTNKQTEQKTTPHPQNKERSKVTEKKKPFLSEAWLRQAQVNFKGTISLWML